MLSVKPSPYLRSNVKTMKVIGVSNAHNTSATSEGVQAVLSVTLFCTGQGPVVDFGGPLMGAADQVFRPVAVG